MPEKFVPHFKAGKELRERVDVQAEAHLAQDAVLDAPGNSHDSPSVRFRASLGIHPLGHERTVAIPAHSGHSFTFRGRKPLAGRIPGRGELMLDTYRHE